MTPYDRQWRLTTAWLRADEADNEAQRVRVGIFASLLANNSPILTRVLVRWWTEAANGVDKSW